MVYAGLITKNIVAKLQALQVNADRDDWCDGNIIDPIKDQ